MALWPQHGSSLLLWPLLAQMVVLLQLQMFGYNKFKAEMINELMAAGTTTTVYRVGDFVDLCRGPHIPTYAVIPRSTPSGGAKAALFRVIDRVSWQVKVHRRNGVHQTRRRILAWQCVSTLRVALSR